MQWLGLLLVFAGLVQLAFDMLAEPASPRSPQDAARLEPRLGGAR